MHRNGLFKRKMQRNTYDRPGSDRPDYIGGERVTICRTVSLVPSRATTLADFSVDNHFLCPESS
jgi:hypothetical protein